MVVNVMVTVSDGKVWDIARIGHDCKAAGFTIASSSAIGGIMTGFIEERLVDDLRAISGVLDVDYIAS